MMISVALAGCGVRSAGDFGLAGKGRDVITADRRDKQRVREQLQQCHKQHFLN